MIISTPPPTVSVPKSKLSAVNKNQIQSPGHTTLTPWPSNPGFCVSWQNRTAVLQNLKPGDILFPHTEHVINWRYKATVDGQAAYMKAAGIQLPYPKSHLFSHTQLYTGNYALAESIPDPDPSYCRIIRMDEPYHREHIDPSFKALVFRANDPELAAQAAAAAHKFADPFQKDGKLIASHSKYDTFKAAQCAMRGVRWNFKAFRRYLKAAIYGRILNENEGVYSKKNQYRPFTCTYFVTFCYQAAEGMRKLAGLGKLPARATLETQGKPDPGRVSACAAALANDREVLHAMQSSSLKIDQKWMMPVDLLQHLLNSPDFKQVGIIGP